MMNTVCHVTYKNWVHSHKSEALSNSVENSIGSFFPNLPGCVHIDVVDVVWEEGV